MIDPISMLVYVMEIYHEYGIEYSMVDYDYIVSWIFMYFLATLSARFLLELIKLYV